ncbi:MAG: energy transducer TonB, partial [Holophagales bacterium]|nr:energy transducer TonB [Holophagales bacterium]
VILTGIVDENGDVQNLEVVKGLPFGLDASALETVQTWKFRPATLDGRPVAVYYHFQVSFALQ